MLMPRAGGQKGHREGYRRDAGTLRRASAGSAAAAHSAGAHGPLRSAGSGRQHPGGPPPGMPAPLPAAGVGGECSASQSCASLQLCAYNCIVHCMPVQQVPQVSRHLQMQASANLTSSLHRVACLHGHVAAVWYFRQADEGPAGTQRIRPASALGVLRGASPAVEHACTI